MTTLQSTATERPADDAWKHTPHRRKNTKRWCKGHVGREHTPIIRINTRWTRVYTCGLPRPGTFDYLFGRDRDWTCYHEEACSRCGKVLRLSLPKSECPTFHTDPSSVHSIVKSSENAPY
ncbi:hypothetical protein [Curtobacterium sp. MCBD17_040]|uniref:hypothetical protein n=1 Tax=Curtobacterium sp. MCBD17_040 TaxID=2175674 RepID=UPI000DA7F182|nr:hypothetical protein [Curtobacterium sp. MCBD17_040]WIB65446.1 hypothetical protein DEI94_18805 [Curtobacterium sp. MCBD17_040]